MGIPLPDELTDEAVFAQYDWIINPADPATDQLFRNLSPAANRIIEEFMKKGIPLPDELINEAIFMQYDRFIVQAQSASI